jgi:acetoin utilization deacetylase AcuC-like enzyme
MSLPMVHHPDYVTPLPEGHRFPMPKFGLIAELLAREGLVGTGGFAEPVIAERAMVGRVHDRAYVDAFCDGALGNEAVRRIGLPWSAGLVTRTLTAVAGTTLTCRLAMRHGLACHTAGGTHHAHRGFGSGFCIFNDLAVAVGELLDTGEIDVALVVDLDVHQGDGTAAIFADDERVFTMSMHAASNFPLRKVGGDLDIALPDGVGDDEYLALLTDGERGSPGRASVTRRDQASRAVPARAWEGLERLIERVEPDLVVYDAGVDVHRDDRLGRLALTDAGLMRRDTAVLATTARLGVPTACVIGGGYDRDPARLADRHATLHRAAAGVWGSASGLPSITSVESAAHSRLACTRPA